MVGVVLIAGEGDDDAVGDAENVRGFPVELVAVDRTGLGGQHNRAVIVGQNLPDLHVEGVVVLLGRGPTN